MCDYPVNECRQCKYWTQLDDSEFGACTAPTPGWVFIIDPEHSREDDDWVVRDDAEYAHHCKMFDPREGAFDFNPQARISNGRI